MVFIFDECHRSQFGDNHQAIKEFFPNAQLFGFTGTPIFEENATLQADRRRRADASKTTQDLFQKAAARLHHHPRHRGPQRPALPRRLLQARRQERRPSRARRSPSAPSSTPSSPSTTPPPAAASSTPSSPPPPSTTPSSTTACSSTLQAETQQADPDFVPLNIAAVFSPPAEVSADVQQIQEDLPQEQEDNKHDPEGKKKALKAIIADYNARFGTNHRIDEFDLYYQDVQKRIKDQQFPNADLPKKGREKIDITIVVDMLLTGFDSKYLNTLYVDKNLKHHGLIQAFCRTNRVLNDTKPYGHILDFRGQQDAVDAAIALFSGAKADKAREIWLVDKAPVVIDKLKDGQADLDELHAVAGPRPASPRTSPTSRATTPAPPSSSTSRRCSGSRPSSTSTPTSPPSRSRTIETDPAQGRAERLPRRYLETAQRLRAAAGQAGRQDRAQHVDQLDFEFVLFASAIIDYDYIMKLIADFSGQDARQGDDEPRAAHRPDRSRRQVHRRARRRSPSTSARLKAGEGLDETAIRAGYEQFKAEKARHGARRPRRQARPADRVAAGLRRHHPRAA